MIIAGRRVLIYFPFGSRSKRPVITLGNSEVGSEVRTRGLEKRVGPEWLGVAVYEIKHV